MKTCEERRENKSKYYRFTSLYCNDSIPELENKRDDVQESINDLIIERKAIRAMLKRKIRYKNIEPEPPKPKPEDAWS